MTACLARWPLRMRVSMSASGSLIVMALLLPARLQHAGDLSGRTQLAQGNARHLELAVKTAWPARQLAAVADAGRRAVARQFGQFQLRREAVFRRRVAVARQRLQTLACRRLLLCQQGAAVVFFDRALL